MRTPGLRSSLQLRSFYSVQLKMNTVLEYFHNRYNVRFWHIADRPDKNSGSLLPCLYPEYGLPGGIKLPRNGADTDPGVNPCNHRTLLFFTQY